ncbi:MAG: extracellular solute-binding protein [Polyangiaceae bacterium]|nr:extracellular solute-binding protein [Polyangiaceae bacterium]
MTVEGSVMLLRMHLLHPADVVALADHRLIEVGLRPDDADWAIKFATTEIVIARTQASRYAEEITEENWPEILLRPDVVVGHPDPAIDPCGYYTRLAWKLAERRDPATHAGLHDKLAAKSSAKYQRPDALTVMGLLQARAIDYAFVYRCHAVDHHLPYIRLGDAVGLGQPAFENDYGAVQVDVPDFRGKTVTMKGHPVYLGLTISRRSRHAAQAERFVRFLLSTRGQDILRRSDILPLVPARATSWSARLPQALSESVVVESPTEGGKRAGATP